MYYIDSFGLVDANGASRGCEVASEGQGCGRNGAQMYILGTSKRINRCTWFVQCTFQVHKNVKSIVPSGYIVLAGYIGLRILVKKI